MHLKAVRGGSLSVLCSLVKKSTLRSTVLPILSWNLCITCRVNPLGLNRKIPKNNFLLTTIDSFFAHSSGSFGEIGPFLRFQHIFLQSCFCGDFPDWVPRYFFFCSYWYKFPPKKYPFTTYTVSLRSLLFCTNSFFFRMYMIIKKFLWPIPKY